MTAKGRQPKSINPGMKFKDWDRIDNDAVEKLNLMDINFK